MAAEFAHGTVATEDGSQISFKWIGSGDLPILFMHGWGSTKDYFDETVAKMLLDGIRILSFDMRGHGESTRGREPFTSARLSRDLLAVADKAGVREFVTCGHSMAGKFLQALPALAPGRVLGQVLVAGTPGGIIDVPDTVIEEWAGFSGNPDGMRASHHAIITRPIPHAVSEKWIQQAARIPRDVLKETLEICFREAISKASLDVAGSVPTLIVAAKKDPFFPVEMMSQQLHQTLKSSRMIVLDCGHEIPNEMPQEMAMALECFVAGVASRRSSGRV